MATKTNNTKLKELTKDTKFSTYNPIDEDVLIWRIFNCNFNL
jgi:hypothetical protein